MDRNMENGSEDREGVGGQCEMKGGKERRGIKQSRCWLERGRAVSARGTCCHSEGWGVMLVSAEALRGVRWLWENGEEDRDI